MRKKQVDNSNPVVLVVCHLVTSAVAPVLPVVIVVSVVLKTTATCLLTACHRQAKHKEITVARILIKKAKLKRLGILVRIMFLQICP